jgi:hypothetical protein
MNTLNWLLPTSMRVIEGLWGSVVESSGYIEAGSVSVYDYPQLPFSYTWYFNRPPSNSNRNLLSPAGSLMYKYC